MNYNKKDSSKKNNGATNTGESEISAISCTGGEEDDKVRKDGTSNDPSMKVGTADDDNLDDFFASLE